jgi:hypothetical protein
MNSAMGTGLRKLALLAHVSSSVGWLGAVAAFLALAITALMSRQSSTIGASLMSMDIVGWFVVVPLCFASLVTGMIQSLCTPWGLFRHHWIVAKFFITIFATVLLLLHMQPVTMLARQAAARAIASTEFLPLRIQLVADAGAALIVLFGASLLSIYKPWGLTPYGRRKIEGSSVNVDAASTATLNSCKTSAWITVVVVAIATALLLIVIRHLTADGFPRHM